MFRWPKDREGNEGGYLALSFANTVSCSGCRVEDALGSTREFRNWVTDKYGATLGSVVPGDLQALRALRVSVRSLFNDVSRGSSLAVVAVRAINQTSRKFPSVCALEQRSGKGMVTEWVTGATTGERLLGAIARSAIHLLGGDDRKKLRHCEGPGCAHFILARTGNQIWCSSSGCGNRVRVARHYRRLGGKAKERTGVRS